MIALERRMRALLDLVEADRRQKCDAILAEAQGRRRTLLGQAHADARGVMRKAFQEERLRRDARVDAARANLQTRRRLAEQQRAAALLAAGWNRLPEEMLRRWRTPALRRRWIAAVLAGARASLPAAAWRVIHAPDWPAAERTAVRAELAAAHGAQSTFDEDSRIRAGLRISANGNVIDGTLDGLLADRADIGSQLLQLLEMGAPG
jgi:hypothetical protein